MTGFWFSSMPPLSTSNSPYSSPLGWGLLTYHHAAHFSDRRGPYPSRVALLSVYFRWKWRYFASSTPEELWHEGVPITQRKPPLFVFLLQEHGWLPALSMWKISFCLLQRVRGPQELPLSLVSPQEGLNNPEEGGHRYSLMHTSAAHFVWSLGCQDYPELTGTRVTYMWLVSLSQPQAGAAGSRQDLWPTIHFDCLMKTKFYK